MRTEKEMLDLILTVARDDERIRAVYMNGSRTNPNVLRDAYQDYDIVYIVRELAPFIADNGWIDVFGDRLMLQMPEAMRYPSGAGHFNWMMLFTDGNRLDLTLIPLSKPELVGNDSLIVTLLDKDGALPQFPPPSDLDYRITPPTELEYMSCCNDFWWCMQNVAKGIARRELPYAMLMYHNVVREGLHEMLSWYIGTITDYGVSAGKMGKFFERHLPPELYAQYLATYSDCDSNNMWRAVLAACDLFGLVAPQVGQHLGYCYNKRDEDGMRKYLINVRAGAYEAK